MIEEKKFRLEWWKLILGSVIAIVVALVPLIWNAIDKEEKAPQFSLSSPIFTPKSVVSIYARNDSAQKEQDIHVEWDGLLFHHGAKISNTGKVKYSWEFTPEKLIKDKNLINVGSHKIRFSFNNSQFSDHLQVLLSEQAIVSIPSHGVGIVPSLPSKIGERRALVIGNADYSENPLRNPVNDANLIADRLKESGFDVTLGTNLTRNQIQTIVKRYAEKLGNNDTSIIYFSGHGVQLNGTNYLLPVDTKISDARDIQQYGIPLNQITELTSGLHNQVALYASAPGTFAMDGGPNLQNSPFTHSLAQNITEPNIELSQAFRKVVQEVGETTNGNQIPWLHSTASENIVLNQTNAKGQSASIIIMDTSINPIRNYER